MEPLSCDEIIKEQRQTLTAWPVIRFSPAAEFQTLCIHNCLQKPLNICFSPHTV